MAMISRLKKFQLGENDQVNEDEDNSLQDVELIGTVSEHNFGESVVENISGLIIDRLNL